MFGHPVDSNTRKQIGLLIMYRLLVELWRQASTASGWWGGWTNARTGRRGNGEREGLGTAQALTEMLGAALAQTETLDPAPAQTEISDAALAQVEDSA